MKRREVRRQIVIVTLLPATCKNAEFSNGKPGISVKLSIMNACVLKLIVLGQALLLALPPGLFCVDLGRKAKPVSQASCCSHSGENDKADAGSSDNPCGQPAQPTGKCCCSRETAVTAKVVSVRMDDFAFSSPASLASEIVSLSSHQAGVCDSIIATGPPLRVLHCVWRC